MMKTKPSPTIRHIPYMAVLLLMILLYVGTFVAVIAGFLTPESSDFSGSDYRFLMMACIGIAISLPSFLLGIGLTIIQTVQKAISPTLVKLPFLVGILFPLISIVAGDSPVFPWLGAALAGTAAIMTLFFGYHDLTAKSRHNFNDYDGHCRTTTDFKNHEGHEAHEKQSFKGSFKAL